MKAPLGFVTIDREQAIQMAQPHGVEPPHRLVNVGSHGKRECIEHGGTKDGQQVVGFLQMLAIFEQYIASHLDDGVGSEEHAGRLRKDHLLHDYRDRSFVGEVAGGEVGAG